MFAKHVIRIFTMAMILAAFLGPKAAQGQAVNIPDPSLKLAIETTLGVTDPTAADMLGLTELYAEYGAISDLTGLETATNLQSLYLYGNQISDLSALSGLTKLETLDLYSNQITSLAPLAGLTKIGYLDIGGNAISDLLPLTALTNLHYLYASYNAISSLSPLTGLTELQEFFVVGNLVVDLGPVAGLTHLTTADFSGNTLNRDSYYVAIVELRLNNPYAAIYYDSNPYAAAITIPDANLKALVQSYLGISTDPTDWDMLSLTYLYASNQSITDLTGLEYAKALQYLYLNQNSISDLGALTGLTHIQMLYLQSNPLSQDAFNVQIPQIEANNPNLIIYRDTNPASPAVSFTDMYLKAAVKSQLGITTDPTEDQLHMMTYLSGRYYNIVDLGGLEYAVNLQSLDLYGNQIDDLSVLGSLTKLQTVDLGYNPIVDFSVLAGLGNLTQLDLDSCLISDPSFLSGMTGLTRLSLNWNNLTDISVIGSLTNLTELYLGSNAISDFSVVATLPSLTNLSVYNCGIDDYSFLATMTQLTWLEITANLASDISPLGNLTNLQELYLGDDAIGDYSILPTLGNLRTLGMYGNIIADAAFLAQMAQLETLSITGTFSPLSSISNLTNLQSLWLHNNGITDISPLSGLTGLTSLAIEYNTVSDLSPLANLTQLSSLNLYGNEISDISVLSSLTNLYYFHAGDNQISDLSPLSGLTHLYVLYIYQNQISDLSPLVGMESLAYLNVTGNPLSQESYCVYIPQMKQNRPNMYIQADVNPTPCDSGVVFGDAALKAAVEAALGVTNPTATDMLGLTSLTAVEAGITNLTGLETATNLQILNLKQNSISDLSALLKLTELTSLRLTSNPLSATAYASHIPLIRSNNLNLTTFEYDANPWGGTIEGCIASGRAALAEKTLAGVRIANAIFAQGIVQFGTGNQELVFLDAMTRATMILVREDGGGIDSLIELFGAMGGQVSGQSLYPFGLTPHFKIDEDGFYKKPADAPTRDEIETLIDTVTIPELAGVLAQLNTLSTSFGTVLTTSETGSSKNIEVDYGDIMVFKAGLRGLKSVLETRRAYQELPSDEDVDRLAWQVSTKAFDVNADLLGLYPEFLKLDPAYGLSKLTAARQNLMTAITEYFEAKAYILGETDDQTNDLFYFDTEALINTQKMDEILYTLRNTVGDHAAGGYAWETTQVYTLTDGQSREYELELVWDLTGLRGEKGYLVPPSELVSIPGWRIESFERDGSELQVDFESAYGIGGAYFVGQLSSDGNAITNGRLDYWGDDNGSVTTMSGMRSSNDVQYKQFDLTPVFAGEVSPRDMLPAFGPRNKPEPGTMGHDLDDDATLGGVYPGMVQADWTRLLGLQPDGDINLRTVGIETIRVDGDLNDWETIPPVLTDISDDIKEDPFLAAGRVDIRHLYLAADMSNHILYGAITNYPLPARDNVIDANTYYELRLSYPGEPEPMIVYLSGSDEFSGGASYNGYNLPLDTFVENGVIEFSVSFGNLEMPLAGRTIKINSEIEYQGHLYGSGDKNDTNLKITHVGDEPVTTTLSGTVDYPSYAEGPITVLFFTDPDNSEGSVVSSVQLNGPGSFTLDGIGYGMRGYVRAIGPWQGVSELGSLPFPMVMSNVRYVSFEDGPVSGMVLTMGQIYHLTPQSSGGIQAAIDAANNGDIIELADGTYSGDGNRDLDFQGKAITLRSENGPANCVIDCYNYYENLHRGLLFLMAETSVTIVEGITITGGIATEGSFDPMWDYSGGAILCDESSPTIKNCIISDNLAWQVGGGIACFNGSNPQFIRCTFINNIADGEGDRLGGAVYNFYSNPRFINCLICGNKAGDNGGAIYNFQSSPELINCTVIYNTCYQSGGGIYNTDSSAPVLTNCILWGNGTDEGQTDFESQIIGGQPIVRYSCVQDIDDEDESIPFGGAENHNIDDNPRFVDEGFWYGDFHSGDYHVQIGSPCLNAGFNDAIQDYASDLDGNVRIQGQTVDLGVYEAVSGEIYYSLTVETEGQGSVLLSPQGGSYPAESQVQLTAVAQTGWRFDHWAGDIDAGSANPATITMIGNLTVTAVFVVIPPPTSYTVSVESSGLGTVILSPPGGSYEKYTPVQLTAVPNSGWRFNHWSGDLSGTTNPMTIELHSNITATAVFTPVTVPTTYTLSVQTAGQGSVTLNPSGGSYDAFTTVQLTAIPQNGWQFTRWEGGVTGTSNPASVTMTGNKSVTAVFSETQTPSAVYTLSATVSSGQGTIVKNPNKELYADGEVVTLTAQPADGWQVSGWSGADGIPAAGQASVQITMHSNRSVSVSFAQTTYSLSLSVQGGHGSIEASPSGDSYSPGTVVTLTAHPADGWRITNWQGADQTPATGSLTNTVTMTCNKQVTVGCDAATGGVNVTIIPALAGQNGGQWRIAGGAYHASGETASGLAAGVYAVQFKAIDGWETPGDISVTVIDDQTTKVSGAYVQLEPEQSAAGSLRVVLSSPDGPVDPQSKWRLGSNGAWHNSGATIKDLEPGDYTVEFSNVTGWVTPATLGANITADQTTSLTATYTQVKEEEKPAVGSLQVSQAVTEQARWRIDSGEWRQTGSTLGNLSCGTHQVDFSVTGGNWVVPTAMTVTILNDYTTTISPKFVPVENTNYVSPNGSNSKKQDGSSSEPYLTIQWAIDQAQNGDVVVVAPGTYSGPGNRDLDFKGKSITLRSAEGAGSCIIQCGGTSGNPHRGFYLHSGETTDAVIDGFTITGGWGQTGGGILCENNSSPTIKNCVITGNGVAYSGGGFRCNEGSPTLIDCVITNNTAQRTGAGVFVYEAAQVTLTGCTISANNATGCGSGVYSDKNSVLSLNHCLIIGNKANTSGGGLYAAENSQVSIDLCTLSGNQANLGGAVRLYYAKADVTNSIIWGNTTQLLGPAVDNYKGTASFAWCDVEGSGGSKNWVSKFGTNGGGNLDINPDFVGSLAAADTGTETANAANFVLGSMSPCIDAGDPSVACIEPMPNGGRVNMGAFGNTAQAEATLDSDNDGLSNPFEIRWGLNATLADTDGDGLSDYQEVTLTGTVENYDPYDLTTGSGTSLKAASADTDGDGVSDFDEVNYDGDAATYNPYNPSTQAGSDLNALSADTDGDGMPDGWEITYSLNPINPADAAIDTDGDTYSNKAEYDGFSDPTNPASIPLVFKYDFEIARVRYGAETESPNGQVTLTIEPREQRTITSAAITLPTGGKVVLPNRIPAVYTQLDLFDRNVIALADIESVIPAGTYTLEVTFSDGLTQSISFEHWYSVFPVFCQATSPTDGQSQVSATPTITWGTANASKLEIADADTGDTLYSATPTAGLRTCVIPTGVLAADHNYVLKLTNGHALAPNLASTTLVRFDTNTALAVLYVDANAQGANNGTSWADAYTSLSEALSKAVSGDEIRVAEGDYHPEAIGENTILPMPREYTFALPAGVTVKGGYAGWGAENPNARDLAAYQTILSGLLPNSQGNVYHVVTGDDDSTLDGFIITGGDADGSGEDLQASSVGGGVFNNSTSHMTIANCKIIGNDAVMGGGVFNSAASGSNNTLVNCILANNTAQYGAGVYNDSGLNQIINCTMVDNQAKYYGGGMFDHTASVELFNTILWDNTAKYGPQIAMTIGSHLYAANNDIKGGSNAIYREAGTTLSWANTNIARNPRFYIAPSLADAVVVDDATFEPVTALTNSYAYSLRESSPCINAGNNQAISGRLTDVYSQSRIFNSGTVDIGATEYQGVQVLPSVTEITLTKLSVKAGSESGIGSAVVTGPISITKQAAQDADFIYVAVGPYSLEFDVNSKSAKFKGNTVSYTCTPAKGSKVTLTIDFAKQTFKLDLKNVNLAGITCPVTVEIGVGESSPVRGVASQAMLDQAGTKLPLSLLIGQANALQVDDVKLNNVAASGKDSLAVTGEIALLTPNTDLSQHEIAITYGDGLIVGGVSHDLQLTLPAGSMHRVGTGNVFVYKKPSGYTGPAITAKFDFDKGTFAVTVKNTDIVSSFSGTLNFRVRFADFDQACVIPNTNVNP